MCFSQPACFYILSLDNFEVLTSQFLCGNPAVRITGRHHVRPARCRGQLPRVTVSSPPAAAENTFANCLFARRSGSPIATEFGNPDYDFFEPHSFLCFPLFWGNSFLDRHSTAFVSDISQWSRACCMLGFSTELLRELTVHIAPSYCVNWLFTLLNFVHESSRFSLCSTEHLWIVSPQPRTPTRRRQSIDVYDHDFICRNRRHRRESTKKFTDCTYCTCEFSTPAICKCTWLWLIDL